MELRNNCIKTCFFFSSNLDLISNFKILYELDLVDLHRDLQDRVMNQKSLDEADALQRAESQGMMEGFKVRRPYNKSETVFDFIGESDDGTKIEIDITSTESTGKYKKSFDKEIKSMTDHIIDDLGKAADFSKSKTICDLSNFPPDFRGEVYTVISNELEQSELDKVDFLFD